MRAPLSWIQEFTPVEAPVEDLVAALNQLGLEVEAVDEPGREISGVVVAEVLQVIPHPNADKLTLVDIRTGSAQTRVVCGATNVVAGMHVPYAPVGATLPGGFKLERRKIRGETSDGMLCSAKELGLGEDRAGILGLHSATQPGSDIRDALGLRDVVFDLSITPNRPDAMCIMGVARELAAHFGTPFGVPEASVLGDASIGGDVTVAVEAPDRCPWFTAWAVTVTMGPSPAWMQQRLVNAGMRPINNVVDVTNYVMLERNQPLHAFDLGRLPGRGIVVRLAVNGEKMMTLDDVERTLTDEDLLVCDAESAPQGIAGIMGGATSEVSDATTEVLLEAAYFERMGIARSSKRLKLRSEASARFERGIDPDAVSTHAARGIELLADVAGAHPAKEPVSVRAHAHEPPKITLRTSKVNRVLGTSLTDAEVLDALAPLGIEVEGKADKITAVPPTFRPDLEREIDLVEEVGRRIGFAAIGRTIPKPQEQIGGLTPAQRDRRTAADALVGAGLFEAITLPLVPTTEEDRIVAVANPLRAEDSALRTALIPGLLRVTATNHARGNTDVGLFEIGRVFLAPRDGVLPDEPLHVAALLGGTIQRAPVEEDRPVDVYDAIDALTIVLDALAIAEHRLLSASPPGGHPTRVASLEVSGDVIGWVGELASGVTSAHGVEGRVVGFEVDLSRLIAAPRRDRTFVTPSPYPVAAIDLAFVIGDDVQAGTIASTIRASADGLAEEVGAFDEFRDDSFGPGRRSLAFRVRYRAPDRTLTDAEVATLRQQAIDAVANEHGGDLRG